VLIGFNDDLKKQMKNLAPNETIITNNMNSCIENPDSPEKD